MSPGGGGEELGAGEGSARLARSRVRASPTPDESFARVVLAPQDVVVARNEEAMFHCQFSAQPPPSLQWVFEDETAITNRSR